MKLSKINIIQMLLLFLIVSVASANAQEIDDGVLVSAPNTYTSARTMALGTSYIGIVDDISATIYNPAGLALLPKNEFSMGFNFRTNKAKSSQFGSDLEVENKKFSLNNIGFAYPIFWDERKNRRGAISFLYYREGDYNKEHRTDWYNPNSSIASYYANTSPNILYHIWLSPSWNQSLTPINKNVQQSSTVMQEGSMHNISFGFGFDITNNLALGASFLGKFGSLTYARNYREYDINNYYSVLDTVKYSSLDFNSLYTYEFIERSMSGLSGNIGLLFKVGDFTRISAAVRLPTFYFVGFDDSIEVSSRFDDGFKPNSFTQGHYKVAYNLTTPAIYSFGMSFYAMGLTITTGIEYSDLSSMKIKPYNSWNDLRYTSISDNYANVQNQLIKTELSGRFSWGIGVEYSMPRTPIVYRAAYNSITSPYNYDLSGANRHVFSGGVAIDIGSGMRLNLSGKFENYDQFLALYARDIDSRYILSNSELEFSLGLSYRF